MKQSIRVRAEVDPEAELIIGSITDPELDGKMRVSIVATSLDGQQPETKSVINMVHRIQNRNPGYSDFGTTAMVQLLLIFRIQVLIQFLMVQLH